MRSLLVLLSLAATVHAADSAKQNTLTPKEIEEGWILLFDGETTFGWKTEGEVKVSDGELVVGGSKESAITTTSPFYLFELQLEFKQPGMMRLMTIAGTEEKMILPSPDDWGHAKLVVRQNKEFGIWKTTSFETNPKKGKGGVSGMGESGPIPKDAEPTPIRIHVPANVRATVRSIKIRPLELKPLFNGNDLAGWKFFDDPKRNKSKWTVTREGWLNVKNGPGDLQTEGKYADFLLQLECISNGKWLNSGVFFRCVANEYQNGYEAQIQNGYKDNDRTKPVDFGTGAIYRRVPARKVVPNDNEWFTLTVLAHGNHIATWVNGYQTVDWTDERPPNNNPRNGTKTGAGHISIQGHDPTTDLSFRTIRIAELKSGK
jgi:hypothetical protein